MKLIKGLSQEFIENNIKGHIVHFTSKCETFPLNIKGKVLSVRKLGSEILMDTKVIPNNKTLTIGSNMHKLKYEILR